ncbi:hypothetical protein ACIBG8_24690 [Nonomuraea sp. NPDC050556]|uniref:hypothetical protein n=1 Tax=Nonomuraea sp. NPDC050556 TaxID=3364369 RepID=UPI0037948296
MIGHLAAGGLLQTVGSEVHELGVVAELRFAPLAQAGLCQGGGGEGGVVGLSELGGGDDWIRADDLGGGGKRLMASRRKEGKKGIEIHAS